MIESLGRAVLREDAGFHDYQELQGALRQYGALKTARPVAARRALVALALRGSLGKATRIARRCFRGDSSDWDTAWLASRVAAHR